MHLQQWDGAINCYRNALQLQPDLAHLSGHLAQALQQRAQSDRTSAIAFYQQAIQQNPQDLDQYHQALELSPDDISLYMGLVDALLGQHRLDEALICCQIARQLQPDSPEIISKFHQISQLREQSRQPRINLEADYAVWMQQHTPTSEHLQQMADAVPN